MNIKGIVKDSLRYPFSDWKKILLLGIIVLVSNLFSFSTSLRTLTLNLVIIGLIIGILIFGYEFRIIKSSLDGVNEPPEFNAWIEMFVDGIKVSIVSFVYAIPAILIILVFIVSISSSNISLNIGFVALIAILYAIIVIPILLMAIANMANNDSKLGSAFRFHELINKISTKGWKNLIIWYIVTGIIYLIIFSIGVVVTNIFSLINSIVGIVLVSLILNPYIYMYLSRSVALFYMSE
ncbi:DUF4013 domain-containing protein [Methanobacterium paludis]|uniref:Glycerophosphoryl diester phosphodiesterase membrane domain-containing protein n=1 Tax=Methanobacterium paludis (strain DSM 25820 / JCM 18151 / SWAN1) TaxID=868131 RepID=F6D2G6_METPW|nr:DUF4013 domain-containing protein [Methanobacterium paludis]AEG17323.1 hypothetical protein MSWAN_0279 [Methanobacterium paludis]